MKALRTLRARMIATYMALALLLLSSAGVIFSAAFRDYAFRVHWQRMEQQKAQAAVIIRTSEEQPEVLLARLQQFFPELEFSIVTYPAPATALVAPADHTDPDGMPEPSVFGRTRLPGPKDRIFALVSGRPVTAFSIRAKQGSVPVFQTLYREVVLVVAMGLALSALLGWGLSRWLARPIAGLSRATAAVAEGDFLQTVPHTGTPELDTLVHQFNRMVQRLNDSFRNLSAERDVAKRFASDAAHELKTPLTALRAYHETVQDRPERLPQVMPGMGRQIDRIERIIAGLLQLARLSEGTGIALEPADARDAVKVLEPGFRALVSDWDHKFTIAYAEVDLPVRLDTHLLETALTNLVDNACKFTPVGGQIGIEVSRDGEEAVIAVTDDGPGISLEEQPHIFERFHRATNTQAIPGSGLGLSIVQEAAARMGGRVTVETEPGKGSRFALYVPLDMA